MDITPTMAAYRDSDPGLSRAPSPLVVAEGVAWDWPPASHTAPESQGRRDGQTSVLRTYRLSKRYCIAPLAVASSGWLWSRVAVASTAVHSAAGAGAGGLSKRPCL